MSKLQFAPASATYRLLSATILAGLTSVPTLAQDTARPILLDPITIEAETEAVAGYAATDAQSATGTATPLRQTPQAAQVVTPDLLRDQGAQNIAQALHNVSAAQAGNPLQTPAYDATILRGFPGEQMLDGIATYYNAGDPNAMNNIARIEVLKGPNALLYGGGAGTPLGGVVNILSKLPTDESFAELGVTLGSNGLVAPRFDFNRPLNADGSVLFRMTGSYSKSGADVSVVDIRRWSLNPTLLIGANGPTSLTLQGRISSWEAPEYQGLPAVGTVAGDFTIDPDLFIGDPDVVPSFSRTKSLTATLDHQFNEIWSNRTRLRVGATKFHEYEQLIWGNAPDAGTSSWALYNAEVVQEQHEISLSSHFEGTVTTANATHRLLFGVDASRMDDEGAMLVDFAPLGPVDLSGPVTWPDYVAGAGSPMIDGNNRYMTAGAFVQVQSSLGEKLHLLGGVRLAHLAIENNSPATGTREKVSKTRLLPRLGAVYELNPNAAFYASYAEGMKGTPFTFYSGTPRPETSRSAEIGVKFGDEAALSGSLSLFRIERSNAPVPDPATYGMTSLAEGQSRSQGLELDLAWQASDRWRISANYALVDAELTRGIPGGAPAGSKLPLVPRHSGAIWAHYDMTDGNGDGWGFGAGLRAQSATWVDSANAYKVGGFGTADASVSYAKGGLRADLTVRNLFDRDYFEAYRYLDGRVAKGAGRSIEFGLSKRF